LGCELYLPVRDPSVSAELKKKLLVDVAGGHEISPIHIMQIDLSDLDSVRRFADELKSKTDKLNILINNAGIMGTPESKSKQGYELTFATNHLGHFLLFQLLKPLLSAGSTPQFNSRVVSLTSKGHNLSPVLFDDYDLKQVGYDKWKAYGQSKTANIYLANEIERRYGSQGLHAWSVHPGGIMTNLARHMPEEEMQGFFKANPNIATTIKSPEQGAATTIWAAVSRELEGRGGKYLEDCKIPGPVVSSDKWLPDNGYSTWAYDTEAAKRLWEESNKMVNFKE